MMRALLNIFLTPETTPKEIGHRTEKWTSILGFFLCTCVCESRRMKRRSLSMKCCTFFMLRSLSIRYRWNKFIYLLLAGGRRDEEGGKLWAWIKPFLRYVKRDDEWFVIIRMENRPIMSITKVFFIHQNQPIRIDFSVYLWIFFLQ